MARSPFRSRCWVQAMRSTASMTTLSHAWSIVKVGARRAGPTPPPAPPPEPERPRSAERGRADPAAASGSSPTRPCRTTPPGRASNRDRANGGFCNWRIDFPYLDVDGRSYSVDRGPVSDTCDHYTTRSKTRNSRSPPMARRAPCSLSMGRNAPGSFTTLYESRRGGDSRRFVASMYAHSMVRRELAIP